MSVSEHGALFRKPVYIRRAHIFSAIGRDIAITEVIHIDDHDIRPWVCAWRARFNLREIETVASGQGDTR